MSIEVGQDVTLCEATAMPKGQAIDLSKKGSPVKVGQITVGGPDFAVIAGPCSIESAQQFSETAQFVSSMGAAFLRGGIWKLRTSADSFQGLGPSAFNFIKEICQNVNLPLCSEVTDIRQIEMVDDIVGVYQVGSRNMHNYELLKELGKTRKPIVLKRGFAALVDEWIKAADYIIRGGNDQVILCERGIRTFETATRNTLDLNSVVYLKKHTNFPVIVDPSHAVGVRDLVPSLAYAAAASGADGIIVEVHPRPQEALSDGPQALTFSDFETLMKRTEAILAAFDKKIARPL
ncbi:MAG: 3-deoxy-7-phosphoheptulonate synthase [Pseudomonadota bacterium]|jgi:3-deoxy-7-phosphoheptulonate synthase